MGPHFDNFEARESRLTLPSLLILLLIVLVPSCGKKSAPTLAAYEKPPTPVLIRAVHREDRIILSWSFPDNRTDEISGFTILKSSGRGLQRIEVLKSRRSLTETSFVTGTTYTFRIVARSLTGVLSKDSNALTLTPLEPPPPPAHLSFRIEGDHVILSWEGAGEGILYNVYRSFKENTFGKQPLNSSPLRESSFKDVLHINRPVYYTVRSLRNTTTEDEGRPSPELAVNPSDLVPSAPGDLTYFAAPGKIFLYWKEPSERWITGYRIYRKTGGGHYKLIGETQVPTFLDTDKSLTKRDYRVNAVGPSREGPGAEVKGVFFGPDDLK